MIRKSDAQWWMLEAKKHPESAAAIVEELAQRLAELDAENERLRDEIVRLQHRAPAAAVESAEAASLRQQVATLQRLLEDDPSAGPSAVLLSDRLQAARLPLSQVQRRADEGRPALDSQALLGRRPLLLLARPQDELLLLTNRGRGLKMAPADLPVLAEAGEWPAAEGQELAADERLTAAVAVAEPPRFWTVVTRRGYVRQYLRIAVDRDVVKGEPLVESPLHNDAPVALVDGDRGDLLLLTRWGKAVRFPQRAIAAPGSVALELDPDDAVVAALPLPSDTQILIVTASGFVARRDTDRLAARARPGGAGKPLIRAFDVLEAFPREQHAQLLYLTYSGKLALVSTADVPLHQRADKGTRVRTFDRDPAVAVTLIPGGGRDAD